MSLLTCHIRQLNEGFQSEVGCFSPQAEGRMRSERMRDGRSKCDGGGEEE